MSAWKALRRSLSVLAAAVMLLGGLVTASATTAAAGTTPPPAFGVQYHGMWSQFTDTQRTQMLTSLKAAGTQWVRLDLGWAMLQPNGPGSFDMGWGVPFADKVINQVHADGLHLLVTFWLTPSWANGGAGETALPTDPQTYANALKWAAARYAGKVDAWEIWNEPNMTYSMAGADPAAYTRLLKAAYPAAHAGDPSTQVVFGGPSENDAPWISKAYAAGAHGYFDVMATHPYMGPSNAPPNSPDDGTIYKLTHVAAVHQLMVNNGDSAKPIWFTEFGWSSHANTSTMQNWEWGVTPTQQGQYLVQTLQLLQSTYPYVTNAFWYEASDEHTGTTVNNDNYGLLDDQLRPKSAYDQVKTYLTSLVSTVTSPAPSPSTSPTTAPSPSPSTSPTSAPSPSPTASVTSAPVPTPSVSTAPTTTVTPSPSDSPSPTATAVPTDSPSPVPTAWHGKRHLAVRLGTAVKFMRA